MRVARSWTSPRLIFLCLPILLLADVSDTRAQDASPIGPFVVDARGSLARYGQNAELAAERRFLISQLPGSGLGLDMGAHVYLFRWRGITFGVGASLHTSAGEHAPPEDEASMPGPGRPVLKEPTLRTRFMAFSPQLSFNFGDGDGWSYLSGGMGTSRLSLFDVDRDEPTQRGARTLNYGGGARWFAQPHVAFTVDLRFYAISPLEPANAEPGSPRMTLMVLSIGASFK
jgi:hypothetical protein